VKVKRAFVKKTCSAPVYCSRNENIGKSTTSSRRHVAKITNAPKHPLSYFEVCLWWSHIVKRLSGL